MIMKNIIIAIDSTSIKVSNRGQWIQEDKWQAKKKEYGQRPSYCSCKYKDQRNILA
jgi:hypothetical protein